MINEKGETVTSNEEIKDLAVSTFKKRFEPNKIKNEYKELRKSKDDLFELIMKITRSRKTPPWEQKHLDKVLSNLKTNKSRDPLGLSNIIFKPNVAGSDFKLAILKLMNNIKEKQIYPKALETGNITCIYKRKFSRADFDNYRGIFGILILIF